jgi:D-psicose/D-tagatose/L-ribulose 3-epimerase
MGDVPAHQRQLSVSNIAWPSDKDDEALDLVKTLGFDGVELAPGKVFGDLHTVSLDTVRAYRRKVEDKGLSVSALQAIFFGVQGAHLFESLESRNRMATHLCRVSEIASTLGARACVFGSPTLRDPGTRTTDEANEIAIAFFAAVAPAFAAQNVELCFEANPPLYQCRFVTRTEEAFQLVERVSTPGVALQLDTGTVFVNGEDPQVIHQVEERIGHFHISEPNLVPVGTAGVDHAPLAAALKRSSYPHWISIEMKAADDWRDAINQAYNLVHPLYRAT